MHRLLWVALGAMTAALPGCGARDALDDGGGRAIADAGRDASAQRPDATAGSSPPPGGLDASSGSSHPVVVDGGPAPNVELDASVTLVDAGAADAPSTAPPPAGATSYLMSPAHTNAVADALLPPIELAWTRSFQFGPASYPLIAGGLVYVVVGTQPVAFPDASMDSSSLVALDAVTGATRWGPVGLGTARIAGHALDGGRVFVVDASDSLVRAFDAATGALLWSAAPPAWPAVVQPPTAYRGMLYVATQGHVGALDEASGKVVWTTAVGAASSAGSPAVSDDGVFVSYGCSATYAFDRATGTPLWTYAVDCPNGSGLPASVYGGSVFVPSSAGFATVLGARTGIFVGTTSLVGLPAFVDDLEILGSPSGLEALDLTQVTGKPNWVAGAELTNQPSPVVAGHTIYAGTGSGALFALDETTGATLYREEVALEKAFGPFATAEGVLVVPFGSEVLAYRHADRPDAGVLDVGPNGGCPAAGCLGAPRDLVTGAVHDIALDANNLYFTTDDSVLALPKGAPQNQAFLYYTQTGMVPDGIAVDATRVYWTVPTPPTGSPAAEVLSMPVGGGLATMLATDVGVPHAIVVGSTHAYWKSSVPMADAVMTAPLGGGAAPAVLLTQRQVVSALAIDAKNVYWSSTDQTYSMAQVGGTPSGMAPAADALASDGTYLYLGENAVIGVGSVWRVPVAGGAQELLIDGRLSPITSLAVDEANVYWLEGGNVGGPGALVAVPKAGGSATVLAAGLDSPTRVVVDASGVYYVTSLGISVVPKTH